MHLWVEKDPGTVGRKLGHQVRKSPPFSSWGLPSYRPGCPCLSQAPEGRESPLGTWKGLLALLLIYCVVQGQALPFSGPQSISLKSRANNGSPNMQS